MVHTFEGPAALSYALRDAAHQKTLEAFVSEKDRLVNIVPGKGDYGSGKGIESMRGSPLVFEAPEQDKHSHQR